MDQRGSLYSSASHTDKYNGIQIPGTFKNEIFFASDLKMAENKMIAIMSCFWIPLRTEQMSTIQIPYSSGIWNPTVHSKESPLLNNLSSPTSIQIVHELGVRKTA